MFFTAYDKHHGFLLMIFPRITVRQHDYVRLGKEKCWLQIGDPSQKYLNNSGFGECQAVDSNMVATSKFGRVWVWGLWFFQISA